MRHGKGSDEPGRTQFRRGVLRLETDASAIEHHIVIDGAGPDVEQFARCRQMVTHG
jgi:hypothetical protein